jgi:hypothetical protein
MYYPWVRTQRGKLHSKTFEACLSGSSKTFPDISKYLLNNSNLYVKWNRIFQIYQPAQSQSFVLFGPRGTGKTTWVRSAFPKAIYTDLFAKRPAKI